MVVALVGALLMVGEAQMASPPAASRWSLRVDPARCVLERQSAEPLSTLLIETTPGIDSYRVVIVSKDIKGSGSLIPASLVFGPGQEVLTGLASVAKLSNGKPFMRVEGISPALLDDLAMADTMTITTKSNSKGTISVPNAAKAVTAFRKCSADQLIEWGADASQFAPGGRTPVALKDRDEWISDKDFMVLAGQSHQADIDVLFRVSVSAIGVVEDSRGVDEGIEKGIEKGVEKVACSAVMNKPLFTPGKNPSGAPVRGVATFRVRMARRPS